MCIIDFQYWQWITEHNRSKYLSDTVTVPTDVGDLSVSRCIAASSMGQISRFIPVCFCFFFCSWWKIYSGLRRYSLHEVGNVSIALRGLNDPCGHFSHFIPETKSQDFLSNDASTLTFNLVEEQIDLSWIAIGLDCALASVDNCRQLN